MKYIFALIVFLNCLTVSKLHSAAVPERTVISRTDQAAFTAIMQMFAIAEKYQDSYKSDINFCSNVTNPAQILNISYSRGPVCEGITATGLYITKDSQYVGSPFGMIRLYCLSSGRSDMLRDFGNTLKSKFQIEKLDDRISICSPEGCYDFSGRIYKIIRVRNSELPTLELTSCSAHGKTCSSDIDAARRKWCALTKKYAATSASVAAKIHDERAIKLAETATVVDGWAEQAAASLATLNKRRTAD